MNSAEITSLLHEALPGAQVHLEPIVDDGDHYQVNIIYDGFVGKSRVQQHKLVYDALGGRVGNQLHALSIKTAIPKD